MDQRYLEIPSAFQGDPRLTPMRHGVAASYMRGLIKAERFAEGKPVHVTAPVCVLKREPNDESAIDTQLVYGEGFTAYGEHGSWVWGQSSRDQYVGWVRKNHIAEGGSDATHQVMSRGTFLYSEADMKSLPIMKIPMASQIKVLEQKTVRGTDYVRTQKGWLIRKHVRALNKSARDFVLVAESMIGMTYLWAGRSTFGLDCSGLIQLAMQMAGIAVLRDSDMQEATIGQPVAFHSDLAGLQRGDLVFWPGHVGVMRDAKNLLHANGHTMTVFSEPLKDAVDRIAYLYGKPKSVRRPFALSASGTTAEEVAFAAAM